MKGKLKIVAVMTILGMLFFSGVVSAEELAMSWKNGIRFESPDKDFKLNLGGRIMNDWAFFSGDAALGEMEDGTEFRRARLYISGLLYGNVDFKAEYDFAGGDADFNDMWIGYRGCSLGHIKIGHFKEPFSLDYLTSANYITFMERSLPGDAFSLGRNTGIGMSSSALDNRLTWALGVFHNADSFGNGSGSDYNFTARVTGLPWYEENGSKFLHIGASYSYKNVDSIQYKTRPESHLAPILLDTGELVVDNASLIGLECSLVYGPLGLQGEHMTASPDLGEGSDPDFSGYYVEASYFLTGENKNYNTSSGFFGRVTPHNSLGKDGGYGAWQAAARYSSLDLNDAGISGGKEDDITLGLNWLLNPNTRVTCNYVRADVDSVGKADVFQMRFQIDF